MKARSIMLFTLATLLALSIFTVPGDGRVEMEPVMGEWMAPPPDGYIHRPLIEFFTGLSCPACMGSGPEDDSPEKAVHDNWIKGNADPSAPYSTVVFHELNGGGVDDLNTDKATERMRFYQPGLSGTPDVQFDGGYIEIGGFSASNKPIDSPTIDWAISESKTRDQNAPLRPLERLSWSFPYVKMEVDQIFDGSSFYVEVKASYESNAKMIGGNLMPLQGELYVFMVEDNVTAYSLVYDMNVTNDAVFRGYAAEGESITLAQGQEETVSLMYDIPDSTIPIKPQDMYAIAAIFDTQDTDSSPGGTDGNQRAGSPRCVQSATSRSTAYDRENEAPKVTDISLSGDTLTVIMDDEGGIALGYVFVNTEGTDVPIWEPLELTISGEELCDEDTGVCYAYSDATGTATLKGYDGGTLYAQALIYDDMSAQTSSEVFSIVEVNTESTEKDMALFALSGPSLFLIIGIILVVLGPVLYMLTKNTKGGMRLFRNKGILSIFIIIGMLFSLYAAYAIMAPSRDTVPDFSLKDTDGITRTDESYQNKVLVIDIMSTDCEPCNEEMPTLIEIYKEAKDRYGSEVEFLTVSISSYDTDSMLDDFQSEYGATWPIGKNTDFVTLFDAKYTPTMIIVAPNGDLAYRHVGVVEKGEVLDAIDDAHSGEYSSVSIRSSNSDLVFVGIFAGILGAATIFSPCSFPMLPGYFSFYLSTDNKGKENTKKMSPLIGGLFAAAGIITFYLLIGLIVTILVFVLGLASWTSWIFAILMPLVGVLMIVFGILMFVGKDAFLERFVEGFKHFFSTLFKRDNRQAEMKGGGGGLYVYGFGYGAASASCMAPLFLTVLVLGFQGGVLGAPIAFIAFSLALGGMMVLFSNLAASGSSLMARLVTSTEKIKKFTAILLVLAGIFVLLYNFFLEEYFTALFNF